MLCFSCSTSLPAQAPPTAGHVVGQQQLASYLEKALDVGPHNVVLFLQDKVPLTPPTSESQVCS